MQKGDIDLLASYWTFAGPRRPSADETQVSPWTLEERIGAVRAAGFAGAGFLHEDLIHWERQVDLRKLRRILDGNDIRYVELEMLFDFAGKTRGKQELADMRSHLLRAATILDAAHIKVGSAFGPGPCRPEDMMVEAFVQLCREAKGSGTRIALEPMPFTELSTPAMALKVVEAANQDNGGIVLDIWHVARAGVPFDELRSIPGDRIFAVELNDAPLCAADDLALEATEARLLCGHGELDIVGFLEAVSATGFDGPFGVEILSKEHRKLPLQEQTERAFTTAMAQLQRAFP
jgi:sugar phosphate isomerase/epimerase